MGIQLNGLSYGDARKKVQEQHTSMDAFIHQQGFGQNNSVTAQSGYTLWDIAEAVYREKHGINGSESLDENQPAQTEVVGILDQIKQLNNLSSDHLGVGQVVQLGTLVPTPVPTPTPTPTPQQSPSILDRIKNFFGFGS